MFRVWRKLGMDSHKLSHTQYLYDDIGSNDDLLNVSRQQISKDMLGNGAIKEIDESKQGHHIHDNHIEQSTNENNIASSCSGEKQDISVDVHLEKEDGKNVKRSTINNSGSDLIISKDRPSACVFVASLSSNISDDVLCKTVSSHFKQWGNVTFVKVLRDLANRPYAFVQYGTDQEANKAIIEGQHSILNNRTIRCEKARVNRTLFVHVSNRRKISTNDFQAILETYGEIEKLVPAELHFKHTRESTDINQSWFAKFVYRQDAINAFAGLKLRDSWRVEWAQNLDDERKSTPDITIDRYSVFVGHLDLRITKSELIERFELHGKIKEAILVNRPVHNFAFIKFFNRDAAAAAVERENHSLFKYKTIYVQYREMYNNNSSRKRYPSLPIKNEIQLNLAPPPVNFKRRGFSKVGSSITDLRHHSYEGKLKLGKRMEKRNKNYEYEPLSTNDNLLMYSEVQNITLSACVPRIMGQIDPLPATNNICAGTPFGVSYQAQFAENLDMGLCSSRDQSNKKGTMSSQENLYHKKDDDTVRSTNTDYSCEQRSLYTLNTEESSDITSGDVYITNTQFNQPQPYHIPYYYVLPPKGINYMSNSTLQIGMCEPSTSVGVSSFSPVSPSQSNLGAPSPNFMMPYPGFSDPSTGMRPSMLYPFYMYYCDSANEHLETKNTSMKAQSREKVCTLPNGSL